MDIYRRMEMTTLIVLGLNFEKILQTFVSIYKIYKRNKI